MHRAPEEEGEWRTRKKNKCFGRIRGQNGLRYQSAKRSTYRPTYLVVYKVCLRDRRASFDACANLGRPVNNILHAGYQCQPRGHSQLHHSVSGKGKAPYHATKILQRRMTLFNGIAADRPTDRPSDCAPACIVDGRASSVPLWRRGWVDGWMGQAGGASQQLLSNKEVKSLPASIVRRVSERAGRALLLNCRE